MKITQTLFFLVPKKSLLHFYKNILAPCEMPNLLPGFIFESDLSLENQVRKVIQQCFSQLRIVSKIKSFPSSGEGHSCFCVILTRFAFGAKCSCSAFSKDTIISVLFYVVFTLPVSFRTAFTD